MKLSRLPVLLALAAVPLLAACGSDDGTPAAAGGGGGVSYAPAAPKKDKAAAAVAPAAGEVQVKLAGSQFAPANVTVKVGEKIAWTNADSIPHTVTATENAKFDSGTLEGGGKFEYVAKKPGTISYVCQFHPGMTGTITVQ